MVSGPVPGMGPRRRAVPPAALGVALASVGALAGACVRTVAPLSARSLPDWWGGAALALECLVCLCACCLLGARCGRRPGLERLTRFDITRNDTVTARGESVVPGQ